MNTLVTKIVLATSVALGTLVAAGTAFAQPPRYQAGPEVYDAQGNPRYGFGPRGNISELTCPPSRQNARRWSAKLSRSIELRDSTELDTLADAAQFILGLHEAYQDRNSWMRASELLMEAAERGGSIEAVTEQFELALFLEARYVRQ